MSTERGPVHPVGKPSERLVTLFSHFVKLEVHGLENIPVLREQSYILAFFPHSSHVDNLVVLKALQDHQESIVIGAKAPYWEDNQVLKWIAGRFARWFPVRESNIGEDNSTLDDARSLMDQGYSIVFAPEGGRSTKPLEERRVRKGISVLALLTGVSIIPIVLVGPQEVLPKGKKLPNLIKVDRHGISRYKVAVIIGKPKVVEKVDDTVAQNLRELVPRAKELADDIYDTCIRMIRGYEARAIDEEG